MRYNERKLQLRYVHSKSKTDIFVYLYERWLIYTDREYFDFPYFITLDDNGALKLTAEIPQETLDVIEDAMKREAFIPKVPASDGLDVEEMEQIDFLFDKYGLMDYDTIMEEMFSGVGNYISPELSKITALPFILNKEYMLDNIGR